MFEQECRFLSEIRHLNIVQYLDVAQDPQTGLPILLMDLMDDSLTHVTFWSCPRPAFPITCRSISTVMLVKPSPFDTPSLISKSLQQQCVTDWCCVRAMVADFGMSKLTAVIVCQSEVISEVFWLVRCLISELEVSKLVRCPNYVLTLKCS